jgi:hypothetical protein
MTESSSQTCSRCGAPLDAHGFCAYCGDPKITADKERAAIDFFTHINNKLATIPPDLSWRMVLVWASIPVLAIVYGIIFTRSILGWLVVLAVVILGFIITTIAISAMHERYQTGLFYKVLYPLIENFMQKQELELADAIRIAASSLASQREKPLLKYLKPDTPIEVADYPK